MKLKKLEGILGNLDVFEQPKLHLEQYPTTAHIASHMLYTIDQTFDEIKNKVIGDLGCGCGVLSVGSAILGSGLTIGVDIDTDALEIAKTNIIDSDINTIDLIQCDIQNLRTVLQGKVFDTIIMNPPFGTKNNTGIDMVFLDTALSLAKTSVYSLHKTTTRAHIHNKAKQLDINMECKPVVLTSKVINMEKCGKAYISPMSSIIDEHSTTLRSCGAHIKGGDERQSDLTVKVGKNTVCIAKETKLERHTKVEETFIKENKHINNDDDIKEDQVSLCSNTKKEAKINEIATTTNINNKSNVVKLRGAPENTQRRCRSKLCDRTLARRKSFLKKGDGALVRKRTKNVESEEKYERTMKVRSSLFCLSRKKEATFVLKKKSSPKPVKQTLPDNVSKPSRKYWNETEIKNFEKMIFSSIFAFSDDLRESSSNISSQLQALHDMFQGKKRELSSPVKNKNVFAQQWRENNEDFLNSGCQEIAGIFRNLRKVETNLEAIENTITAMNKLSLKERNQSPKKREKARNFKAATFNC